MPSDNQISLPAGYAPACAIGYSDPTGNLIVVDTVSPLPVTLQSASGPATSPLEGEAIANLVAGPFTPASGKPVVLTLGGQWEGSVQVERSSDSGTTRHKLTAAGQPWGLFTGNACEIVWVEEEADAELYLDIAITSGTLEYRIAQ